jgi:hypothetical protein
MKRSAVLSQCDAAAVAAAARQEQGQRQGQAAAACGLLAPARARSKQPVGAAQGASSGQSGCAAMFGRQPRRNYTYARHAA